MIIAVASIVSSILKHRLEDTWLAQKLKRRWFTLFSFGWIFIYFGTTKGRDQIECFKYNPIYLINLINLIKDEVKICLINFTINGEECLEKEKKLTVLSQGFLASSLAFLFISISMYRKGQKWQTIVSTLQLYL